MSQLKISVIIPVYEEKEYLSSCLDSLLNQDFKENYDILLIETGSDDGSDQICKAYQEKAPNRVFWYHYPENKGISYARNLGLLHAMGEYVTFVDGDDTVSKDYLSSLYSETGNSDIAIVTGGHDIVDGEASKKVKSVSYHGDGNKALLKFYSGKKKYFNYTCWARLYKRSFLQANKLFFPNEVGVYEDFIFLNEAFSCSCQTVFFKEVIYHYRKHSSSTLAKKKDHLTPALSALQLSKMRVSMRNPELAKKLFSHLSFRFSLRIRKEIKKLANSEGKDKKKLQEETKEKLALLFVK